MSESLFLAPDESAPDLPSPRRRALLGLLLPSVILAGGGWILLVSAGRGRPAVSLPGPRRYPAAYRVKIATQ